MEGTFGGVVWGNDWEDEVESIEEMKTQASFAQTSDFDFFPEGTFEGLLFSFTPLTGRLTTHTLLRTFAPSHVSAVTNCYMNCSADGMMAYMFCECFVNVL